MCAVIVALAVARVTRLITLDYLTAGPRQWAVNKLGLDSKWAYLLSCPWCASVWVAAAAAPTTWWWHHSPWFLVPAYALAFSQVTGLVLQFGEGD